MDEVVYIPDRKHPELSVLQHICILQDNTGSMVTREYNYYLKRNLHYMTLHEQWLSRFCHHQITHRLRESRIK